MITPDKISERARRRYPDFLNTWLRNEPFTAIIFPVGKLPADLDTLRREGNALKERSKSTRGFGYEIIWMTRQTRALGTQDFPDQITIANAQDYLKLLGKEREFAKFADDVALIRTMLPALETWLQINPLLVVEYHGDWADLMAVCQYFLDHPQPRLYIRELPINIHTKFIEQHGSILKSLLDALLKPHLVRESGKFEERYGLRTEEPRIWFRFLDHQWEARYGLPIDDVNLPVNQFARLTLFDQTFLITENKMTFLTVPPLPNSVAVWGGGFNVAILSNIEWLQHCRLIYWGDLDIQGFQILSLLRRDFPAAQSLMMDRQTFETFKSFVVTGRPTKMTFLPYLSEPESLLAEFLAFQNLRLEQEHISQAYILSSILSLFRTEPD